MRQRIATHRPHTATIERQSQTGTNELGEPITETVTVAEAVRCAFSPVGTEFVRTESGERVQRPATVRFESDVDVRAGDRISVANEPDQFEVRGVTRNRDHRRGRVTSVTVEVERA